MRLWGFALVATVQLVLLFQYSGMPAETAYGKTGRIAVRALVVGVNPRPNVTKNAS